MTAVRAWIRCCSSAAGDESSGIDVLAMYVAMDRPDGQCEWRLRRAAARLCGRRCRMFARSEAVLLAVTLAACAAGPRPLPGLARCIWIDRWDWRDERDIEHALDECERAGFTAVLFQVRGNGTVCYPSGLEPWSEHFHFRDPG